jgi:hypothetical protein
MTVTTLTRTDESKSHSIIEKRKKLLATAASTGAAAFADAAMIEKMVYACRSSWIAENCPDAEKGESEEDYGEFVAKVDAAFEDGFCKSAAAVGRPDSPDVKELLSLADDASGQFNVAARGFHEIKFILQAIQHLTAADSTERGLAETACRLAFDLEIDFDNLTDRYSEEVQMRLNAGITRA